ncbi:Conserved_hypothetical protein [Hexamita inflata]|uniref:Uncharacterized protein n=1 Tax=Hexamita inflata TaxID=28002 RepID=A0AA86TE27_9EUKA|nr:Conserved hypothetical protein [Hexamita inflata]
MLQLVFKNDYVYGTLSFVSESRVIDIADNQMISKILVNGIERIFDRKESLIQFETLNGVVKYSSYQQQIDQRVLDLADNLYDISIKTEEHSNIQLFFSYQTSFKSFSSRMLQIPYVEQVKKLEIMVMSDMSFFLFNNRAEQKYQHSDIQDICDHFNVQLERYLEVSHSQSPFNQLLDKLFISDQISHQNSNIIFLNDLINSLPEIENFQIQTNYIYNTSTMYVNQVFNPILLIPGIIAAEKTRKLTMHLKPKNHNLYRIAVQIFFYLHLVSNCNEDQIMYIKQLVTAFGTNFNYFSDEYLDISPFSNDIISNHNIICLLYALHSSSSPIFNVPTEEREDFDIQFMESILELPIDDKYQSKTQFQLRDLFKQLNISSFSNVFKFIPVPYPLTIELDEHNFLVKNRVISTAFLISKIFDVDQKFYFGTKNFEDQVFIEQLQLFQCLKDAGAVHIVNKNDVIVQTEHESTIYCQHGAEQYLNQVQSSKDVSLFNKNSGCYSFYMYLNGVQLNFKRVIYIDYGMTQFVSFEEIKRIKDKYQVELCTASLKPIYLNLQNQPTPHSALSYLMYLNDTQDKKELILQSAQQLSLSFKQLLTNLFLSDLNQRNFDQFAKFLIETQGMFNKSPEGKKFTQIFSVIEDIKILLRGAILNWEARDNAHVYCQYLCYIDDKTFFENIVEYIYKQDNYNKNNKMRQIIQNLMHGIVFLLNYQSKVDICLNLINSQLNSRNAQLWLEALMFYQFENQTQIIKSIISRFSDDISNETLSQVILTQFRLFHVDYLQFLKIAPLHQLLIHLILDQHMRVNQTIIQQLKLNQLQFEETDRLPQILLKNIHKQLCLKGLICIMNLTQPTLSDQPVFEFYELLNSNFNINFLNWNLNLKFFLQIEKQCYQNQLYNVSDFQCINCYFGTCNCQQISQIINFFCSTKQIQSQKMYKGIQNSKYIYRGKTKGNQQDFSETIQQINVNPQLIQVIQTLLHDQQTVSNPMQQCVTQRNRTNFLVDFEQVRPICIKCGEYVLARRVVLKGKKK